MQVFLFIFAILGMALAQQTDVCTQVSLMSQYCSSQGANGSAAGQIATMKVLEQKMVVKLNEMEARLRRTLGSPPDVNYTLVNQIITGQFKGVEDRVVLRLGQPPKVNYTAIDIQINERFQALEARVNGQGGLPSIVDYDRIGRMIDARFQRIQAHVDSKFALLINDTEQYDKAMETIAARRNITDCDNVRQEDAVRCDVTGGVFDIYRGNRKFEVYCDTHTDGGGWTMLQRRMDGSVLFNRTMEEYVKGFGNASGELWLGLETLNLLTSEDDYEMRIDLTDSYGQRRFQKYRWFHVTGKGGGYTLMLRNGNFGDAGDRLSWSHGQTFKAFNSSYCKGGWWGCHSSYALLNNPYASSNYKSSTYYNHAYWYDLRTYSLVKIEMKFRKVRKG